MKAIIHQSIRAVLMLLGLLPVTGVFSVADAEIQPGVKAVIVRAIEAHGGMDRLSLHRADRVKAKGVIQFAGGEARFQSETMVQLPDQMKSSQEIEVKGKTFKVVQICNKADVLMQINQQPRKAEPAVAQQIQDTMRLARLIRLVPLLNAQNLVFEDLGMVRVGEKPARAIRILERGYPEVVLAFDQETGYLVKSEVVRDFENKKVVQEDFFFDFRDVSGFKRPAKLQSFRNGKKILDAELVEVRYFEKLDASEFKP